MSLFTKLGGLCLLLVFVFLSGCSGKGNAGLSQLSQDGLLFTYDTDRSTLEVRLDAGQTDPIVFPTDGFAVLEKGSSQWTLPGQPIQPTTGIKINAALWDFDRCVAIRPGMSCVFSLRKMQGASVRITVGDSYTVNAKKPFARLRFKVWQGSVVVPPPANK